MVGEVVMGLSAFKGMLDIAKGLKDLNDAVARNGVAIELQEKILAAQEQQAALIERVRDLEKEVARLETWETEKQRYALHEFAQGQFAYRLKADASGSEPPHMLCTNCYDHGQKSILHTESRNPGRHQVTFCPNCESEWFPSSTGGRNESHPVVKRGSSWVDSRRRR